MKPFAVRTRDALTRGEDPAGSRDARVAGLTGLYSGAGLITLTGGGGMRLTFRTAHAGTGRWAVRLLRSVFGIRPGLRIIRQTQLGGRIAIEVVVGGDAAARVTSTLGLSPLRPQIPKAALKTRRSRDAFLRGLFLACGTLADPEKGYQMEFRLDDARIGEAVRRFLGAFYGVAAGLHVRRDAAVVYLRKADDITRLLSAIGAHSAILALEDARITRDARGRANRAANCDSGNITKMLGASGRQLDAIALIERTIGLDALPATLREVAMERRLNADASLEALGALLDPPVGKSGVHHRLRRIQALADSIAEREKEGQS